MFECVRTGVPAIGYSTYFHTAAQNNFPWTSHQCFIVTCARNAQTEHTKIRHVPTNKMFQNCSSLFLSFLVLFKAKIKHTKDWHNRDREHFRQ